MMLSLHLKFILVITSRAVSCRFFFFKSYDILTKTGVKSQLLTLVCAGCVDGISVLNSSGNISYYF